MTADFMPCAANLEISLGTSTCRSRGALRAVRLTLLMLTALTSTPGLTDDLNSTGPGPVASVSIDHMTFTPGELTVAPGTTVTWVNNEMMPHNVVDSNKSFRSKILPKDGTFSFTFTTAGDYNYACLIHPNMKGKIIVKPGAS